MNYTDYLIEEYLTEWNAKQIQAFKDKFGDETFTNFEKAKDRLKNAGYSTDIQYYLSDKISKKELDALLISLYNGKKDEQKKRNLEGKIREVRGEYKYFGEFGRYLVFQPLDYLAAMDLGVNSGWCTTGRFGHAGDPNFTPSEKDAKEHFNEYTDDLGVEFYHFLNPRTFYGEYALAVYPDIKTVNENIYDKQTDTLVRLIETDFELFNANDDNIWYDCDVLEIARNNLHLDLYIEFDDSNSVKLQNGFEIDGNVLKKYYGKDLKVVIPNGITEIGDHAFKRGMFKKITIPNSVTKIGAYAFAGCEKLRSIEIPDSVTEIGADAFLICKSLESITIPDSVRLIGCYTFAGCEKLKSVTIPNSVTKIGAYAFLNCFSLESIEIPYSITEIGMQAFDGCEKLKSVTIPNSVTEIKCAAFAGCEKLKSVTLPNSVTKISDGAFMSCVSLTSITIPDGVTEIGESAFNGCDYLNEIYISSTNKNKWVINELREYANVYDKDTGELLYEKT